MNTPMSFNVHDIVLLLPETFLLGAICAILLIDLGISAVRGAIVVVVLVVVLAPLMLRVAVADGPPFRLTVWPVKTRVVEVPALLVSVTVARKLPASG